jgi:DNA polymerase III subunit epsilon
MTVLNLKRPLALIDLETTGVNPGSDRIVEISVLKVFPGGEKITKTKRINPTIPIPIQSSEIHGIYDNDVKDCPTFKAIAKDLEKFLENCDLAGYNSNRFDIPLLVEEFLRAGIDFEVKNRKLIDVQNIFHFMEQRTLVAAYRFYCNKELENAHSAEADILATFEVLEAQIKKYEGVEVLDKKGNKYLPVQNDINALHEVSSRNDCVDLAGRIIYNEKGIEVFSFGKHKDKSVEEIFKKEPSYYQWMMDGDFPLYTKKVITAIRLRGLNSKVTN